MFNIRWFIRRDLENMMHIEQASFDDPWAVKDFITCFRQRNVTGMVAEQDQQIVGFVVYELHKSSLYILNFAVDPDQRRKGIGKLLVAKLVDKLNQQRRMELELGVRESNLAAQLFFQSCGFIATDIQRNWYDDTGESAYTMRYRLGNMYEPNNRIAKYLNTAATRRTGGVD